MMELAVAAVINLYWRDLERADYRRSSVKRVCAVTIKKIGLVAALIGVSIIASSIRCFLSTVGCVTSLSCVILSALRLAIT